MNYTMTGESMAFDGVLLHRVRYDDGSPGGWIETEANRDRDGGCRVFGDTKVSARVRLSENVYGGGFPKTSVFGKATLDLGEKAAFKALFPELFPKLTEFWEKLGDLPKLQFLEDPF